jgi:phosphopantothenoylcysteine synthetase/decarboxylase
VLYLVACAALPTLRLQQGIQLALDRGWDVCLVVTPTAAAWVDAPALASLTGHPVRSHHKLPGEPDALPPADAMLVAPTTFNTVNKWAAGITDDLALGLITEAIGLGTPLAAIPFLNSAQAGHPVFQRSIASLREWGVRVFHGPGEFDPPEAGTGMLIVDQFPWHLGLDWLYTHVAKR